MKYIYRKSFDALKDRMNSSYRHMIIETFFIGITLISIVITAVIQNYTLLTLAGIGSVTITLPPEVE